MEKNAAEGGGWMAPVKSAPVKQKTDRSHGVNFAGLLSSVICFLPFKITYGFLKHGSVDFLTPLSKNNSQF
jgi:hypothetical protein